MKSETNHIYIGREDKLTQWAGIAEENDGGNELAEKYVSKLVAKIKELIKNYLQLDNVNFLFGRGRRYILVLLASKTSQSRLRRTSLNLEMKI